MFCVECGKEIPNGVKFCPDCGASQTKNIGEAEQELPFAEVESVEEQELPFAEFEIIDEQEITIKIKKLRKERRKFRLFLLYIYLPFIPIALIVNYGDSQLLNASNYGVHFEMLEVLYYGTTVVVLTPYFIMEIINRTYLIWKENTLLKENSKPTKFNGKKGIKSIITESSLNSWKYRVAFGVAFLIILAGLFGNSDNDEEIDEYKYTKISVSMLNNDDARHPVHVYLDGEHVYGEWVEAGMLVWPIICPDRCADGDYTVAVDWGGDAEYECSFYAKISYEGDWEDFACNYS